MGVMKGLALTFCTILIPLDVDTLCVLLLMSQSRLMICTPLYGKAGTNVSVAVSFVICARASFESDIRLSTLMIVCLLVSCPQVPQRGLYSALAVILVCHTRTRTEGHDGCLLSFPVNPQHWDPTNDPQNRLSKKELLVTTK